ncbi:beta-propeller domain-containing protein [Usitatibacter palustris]|uniref:Beta propeller domain-containing protein n=1 Tax=Usitatibacter palustris TaxID=2732487 RepID=A0A6M4H5L9_9PROT|nr:beta-propeller domain-containing protein [Usitatibacter palustris]QJR14959.1 hypothetical protein DSM104440_01774 [Usitatibacter palustris]
MKLGRICLTLVAFLAALPTAAATLAERSPFAQGLWWNAQRSGHGFEIFNAGTETMVLWYTYDTAGAPVWYSAQGTFGAASWPLRKHRWTNGRLGATEVVGTLGLKVNTPESAEVSFTVGGQAGTWKIEPFRLSGITNEVDHSGVYFNPDSSGWGLSLTHQGDILGGVLYSYDANGAPTWYAGFDRGSTGTVNFYATRGACPTCAAQATTTTPAGRVTFDRNGESELYLRNQISGTFAAGASPDGAWMTQLGRRVSSRPADRQLANFASNASLKAFLDAAMLNVSSNSTGADFSAAPPAASFSSTNLQEAGVDEADVVKTDGNRIYTFTYESNIRKPELRIAQVANDGAQIAIAGTVPLMPSGSGASNVYNSMINAGLYTLPQRLVSLTGPGPSGYYPDGPWAISGAWTGGATSIEIFDTSGSGLPASTWHAKVDGYMVSSRRIGERLYVVARYVPKIPGFVYGTSYPPGVEGNRALLAATPLAQLLPNVSINGGANVPLVDAASIFVPPQGDRVIPADMVVIYAIDLTNKRIAQSLAILGSAEAIYASTDNLYVASSRFTYRTWYGALLPPLTYSTTELHQIRLGAETMTLVGSGSVEGTLGTNMDKAAFRMSESAGRLRVVTSDTMMWGGGALKNRLTILEPSTIAQGTLKTVSYLPNPQRPEAIGKPGELLYGTRFVGDRLYAVTFKLIDPLYVIDLANAADPKIAGALELPGFSEYLHPLPNGLLLGFGKDAKPAIAQGDGSFAWYQGLQLSLFDVSNAGVPREIQRTLIGKRGSDSALLREHHAFASLPRDDGSLAIAIPARIHDGSNSGGGDSTMYPWLESGLLRFEVRGTTPADAKLVQLPTLVTHAPSNSPYLGPSPDAGSSMGRSVIFKQGTVYVGNGKFWKIDSTGNAVGPL